ncbi:MAG: TetR family transcriptional regulator [Bacteroidetes bacterium]|jgi:TetR/AcrR family transcriptional repressor of nem operon|nr:TetR family transcriptional regulator [Bacteroidota bacterium]
MARPLEFDRSEALQQALEVFWENGYEGTSLCLLLRTMDLSRSSFYQSYGSKQRLYEQCLQQYTADVAQEMAEALEAAPSGLPFIEQVLRSIGAAVDEPKGRRGCMVMNASGGGAADDATVAALITEGATTFARVFQAAIEQAQAEGAIAPARNSHVLAQYLVSSRSGLKAMAKAGARRETLHAITRQILHTLTCQAAP